jgi:hypothetical protein
MSQIKPKSLLVVQTITKATTVKKPRSLPLFPTPLTTSEVIVARMSPLDRLLAKTVTVSTILPQIAPNPAP